MTPCFQKEKEKHPLTQTTAPSPCTSPGYLGLIGNTRSYLHLKVLMQHFPQSYYRLTDCLTCVSTSRIRQSVWAAASPTSAPTNRLAGKLAPWRASERRVSQIPFKRCSLGCCHQYLLACLFTFCARWQVCAQVSHGTNAAGRGNAQQATLWRIIWRICPTVRSFEQLQSD